MKIERLEFKNLDFTYRGQEPLLTDVDFVFPLKRNVRIKSGGGAGKSTLLKILAGIETPESGHYFVNELDVSQASFEEFIPYRLNIVYAMDFGGLLGNRTLYDNITLPIFYHKGSNMQERIDWVQGLIKIFDLETEVHSRPHAVRGAMRKAACLIRSVALRPQLLLWDSPTVGLDIDHRDRLVDLVKLGREQGWLEHLFVTTENEDFGRKLNCVPIELKQKKLTAQRVEVSA